MSGSCARVTGRLLWHNVQVLHSTTSSHRFSKWKHRNIHSGYFYSTSSSPLLLRDTHDYSIVLFFSMNIKVFLFSKYEVFFIQWVSSIFVFEQWISSIFVFREYLVFLYSVIIKYFLFNEYQVFLYWVSTPCYLVLSTLGALAIVFTSLLHCFLSVVTSLSSASFILVSSCISSINFLPGRPLLLLPSPCASIIPFSNPSDHITCPKNPSFLLSAVCVVAFVVAFIVFSNYQVFFYSMSIKNFCIE